MTPSASGPLSGSLPRLAISLIRAACSITACAWRTISSPIGVTLTSLAPRSKMRDVELFLELLDRHRQRRLRDEARLGGAPEVLLARDGDDVAQLGERHPQPDHVAGLSLRAFMLSMSSLLIGAFRLIPFGGIGDWNHFL